MKRKCFAAVGLALLMTIPACGGPNQRGFAGAGGFPQGELLLAKGGLGTLYSTVGGERSLGNVYPFDLSPDGSRVLAARSEQEPTGITRTTDLISIDARSLDEQAIVRAGDRESLGPAQWSPDGSHIAYRLTTFDVDSSEVHPRERATETVCVRPQPASASRCFDPFRDVHTFDWHPNGRSLLVAGRGSDPVLRLDLATGATEVVISPGGDEALRAELDRLGYGRPVQFVFPQWSPTGRYIATLVSLAGRDRAYVPAVLTYEGAFVSLGRASGEIPDAFEWAPDRDLLAYTVGEAPYRITELYVHDPMTAPDRFLTTTEKEGSVIPRIDGIVWSTDGRWVALSRPKGVRVVDVEGEEPARELDVHGTVVDWALEPAEPNPVKSQSREIDDSEEGPVCPIAVRYALAEPHSRTEARLVVEDNPQVVSALEGLVTDVDADEESGWAHVTVASSNVALTYRFYLDSARDRLPDEGQAVTSGDVIGGAHELFDLKATPVGTSDPLAVSGLLDEWGCREGLPRIDVLRARLLDGSMWEVRLAEPIGVIGAERAGAYGELEVDGEVVADAIRVGQRPDFSRADFPGFDPPVLLEEFTLADGRRAEHWDLAPSHENDTFAYSLWVEGPGEHMYFSSGQPIEGAELIAQSLHMIQSGRDIESVWFDSERVEVVNQQAVFFLMDPSAPLKGPEVRINTTCDIGNDQGSSCRKAELEVPVYTPGTRSALERATLTRV